MDLCSVMGPGEGMLVGSFARALFLVHSESLDSAYIASRPFRVNAGAVRLSAAVIGHAAEALLTMAEAANSTIAAGSFIRRCS